MHASNIKFLTDAGTWHIGARQLGLASLTHAVHSEKILCQIDANGYDRRDFPSLVSCSKFRSSHLCTLLL